MRRGNPSVIAVETTLTRFPGTSTMRSVLVLLCAVTAADAFVASPMPVMRSALTECRTEAPKAIIG